MIDKVIGNIEKSLFRDDRIDEIEMVLGLSDNRNCSYSSAGVKDSLAVSEFLDKAEGIIYLAAIDKNKKDKTLISLYGAKYDISTKAYYSIQQDDIDGKFQLAVASAIFAYVRTKKPDFLANGIQMYQGAVKRKSNSDILTAIEMMASDFLFARRSGVYNYNPSAQILSINPLQIESGAFSAREVLFGDFRCFKTQNDITERHHKSIEKESISDLREKYNIFRNRDFTEEELAMLESNKTGEDYSPSSNVIIMAEKVKKSWNRPAHLRKTNILLEGPTGTGKTRDSQVFADLIGLPYTKITCFGDMESMDVIGGIYPKLDTTKTSDFEKSLPGETEMMFDPEGCYYQMMGVAPTGSVTKDELLEIRNRKIMEFYESGDGQNTPEYIFYASEIVKAFENGWVLEIQEPTVASAAILMILNSACEKNGCINLPDRVVRRHPDSIIIMTTNRSYEGCKPLNQALRNRFCDLTRRVELPSRQEMIERLSTATGCKDKQLLDISVDAMEKFNEHLQEMGIDNSLSTRNMIEFVADILDGFDVKETVKECLVWNITTDDEDVSELLEFLEQSTRIYTIKTKETGNW